MQVERKRSDRLEFLPLRSGYLYDGYLANGIESRYDLIIGSEPLQDYHAI